MKLHIIHAGTFKLDGGAMFGVVPKSIWQKTNPADANNLCTWAMRCLLVELEDRRILIDTGLGNKQDEHFFRHYEPQESDIEIALARAGFKPEDISDVFFTHLHFDHCGGAIKREHDKLVPTFPNAVFWSNEEHWNWATQPNSREKASFLKENIEPLRESGRLRMVKKGHKLAPDFDIRYFNGHTEAMMIPYLNYQEHTLIYCADALPSTGHIPLPYVMGYDTRPLLTLEEKECFLNEASDLGQILFFEHDVVHECCLVHHTDKGVRLKEVFELGSYFK